MTWPHSYMAPQSTSLEGGPKVEDQALNMFHGRSLAWRTHSCHSTRYLTFTSGLPPYLCGGSAVLTIIPSSAGISILLSSARTRHCSHNGARHSSTSSRISTYLSLIQLQPQELCLMCCRALCYDAFDNRQRPYLVTVHIFVIYRVPQPKS